MVTSSLLPCGLRDWIQAIWLGSGYFNLLAMWQVPKYLLWQTLFEEKVEKQEARLRKAFAALAEDQFASCSPWQVAYNHLHTKLQGIWCPLLSYTGTYTHMHTHKHTDTLIIKIILRRKLTLDGCLAAMYHIKTMELVVPVLADQLTNLNYASHVLIRLLGVQGFQWPKIWLLWRWFQS